MKRKVLYFNAINRGSGVGLHMLNPSPKYVKSRMKMEAHLIYELFLDRF